MTHTSKATASPKAKPRQRKPRIGVHKRKSATKLHYGIQVNMVSAALTNMCPKIALGEGHTLEIIDICEKYSLGDITTKSIVLVNLGTYFRHISTINFYVTPESYEVFIKKFPKENLYEFGRCHNDYQKLKKINKELQIPDELDLYALSKVCKVTGRRVIMPLTSYRSHPSVTKKTGKARFTLHTELDDWYGADMRQHYYNINLPVLRFLQNGSEDIPLTCKISGSVAEYVEVKMHGKDDIVRPCAYELHHINVFNGTSSQKGETDPSKIMNGTVLTKSLDRLVDIMGTVCLSKVAHSNVHMWPCSDINNYTFEQLPWCLQSSDNFYTVCRKYGLDLQYAEFIWSQSNGGMKTI